MHEPEGAETLERAEPSIEWTGAVSEQFSRVIVGQNLLLRRLLLALLTGNHVLIEGVPGLGKTLSILTLARCLDATFRRIQFTPDLLPSDIIGTLIYDTRTGEFTPRKGPIFANIVLADEINRTTPRTQSALLEAMSEEQVSIENQTLPLRRPFMVVATQNPFEFEGTYYLPENQLDRFLLKIAIGYPQRVNEHKILTTQPGRQVLNDLKPVMTSEEVVVLQDAAPHVRMDETLLNYILDLVTATRHEEQLHLGVSPRGALALSQAAQASAMVKGRDYVTPDDVKQLFLACCAHRVVSKTYLHNGDAAATDRILQGVLDRTAAPK